MLEKTIFILGGYGQTGRRLARHFLERQSPRVVIAGRNENSAKQLADQLNSQHQGERAKAVTIDARDSDSLRHALEDVDFFIQAGPALPVETVRALAKSVMDAGADWIDIQVDPGQALALKDFAEQMKAEDRCFATQGGFHPGLPAALIRWAGSRLDTIESARVGGFINPEEGLIMTSGVDELIDLFRDYSAQIYKDGRWVKTGMSMKDMRNFEFGFGIGSQKTSPMTLDEMSTLPDMFPTLQDAGFYIGGFDFVTNMIVIPLLIAGLKVLPWVKPVTWGKLIVWSHGKFNRPPYGTCLHLETEGIKDGDPLFISLDIFHEDEYELTAVPVVSAVEQILEGSIRKPGLHYMAALVDPDRMLSDMKEMGIRIDQKNSETKENGR